MDSVAYNLDSPAPRVTSLDAPPACEINVTVVCHYGMALGLGEDKDASYTEDTLHAKEHKEHLAHQEAQHVGVLCCVDHTMQHVHSSSTGTRTQRRAHPTRTVWQYRCDRRGQ